MKTLIKLVLIFACITASINVSNAQNTRKDKQAAKAAHIKALIDSQNYVFEANYVIPMRGNSRSLNYNYDVVISKDTVISYLPYFGRVDVAPIDPTDGGIKFTSTNFTYDVKHVKNGNYNITITPKEINTQGSKDVRYLKFNVSSSGYATLQVTSNNRDPISFNGTIEKRKAKK